MKRGAIVATLLVTPMLILSAWALFLPSESPIEPQYGTILAEPYYSGVERTWNAGSAGLASVPANWNPVGVPATGDNITFDGTSVYNCTWNVAVTLGDFDMLTGYTGTVTQSASFECVDFTKTSGLINWGSAYTMTCEILSNTGGTINSNALNLIMSENGYISSIETLGPRSITVEKTTEFLTLVTTKILDIETLGKAYINASYLELRNDYGESSFTNDGLLSGTGLFRVRQYTGGTKSMNFNQGTINCDEGIRIFCNVATTSTQTIQLIGDTTLDCDLEILGYTDNSQYMVLSHNSNYELTITGTVTLEGYGSLVQGTGTWTFDNYVQSGAGSLFTQGGDVLVTGDFAISDGTFTGDTDYDLICSGNYTESDDGIVTDGLLNLVMDGDTKVITSIMPWEDYYHSVTIDGDIEITHTVLSDIFVKNLTVTVGNTLTIDYPKIINMLSNGTYSNLGTVTGYYILFWCNEVDRTITLGTITDCDVEFTIDDADADRTVYLGENTVIGGNGKLIMDSDDLLHTITLHHNSDYTLTVNGDFANILDRSILIQGTGTWTFYDYSQSGTDAIFYQGGLLTIGVMDIDKGQFISNGDAITVTDDWSSKGFIHGNGVVYLTSADANINMDSGDSFYNVTVSGNYIMNTDTNVDLRATITGTVTGTGDFIEPLPVFTRIIVPAACPLRLYESPIEQQYWDAVSLETAPYWMYLEDDVLKGIPGENDTGSFAVSVSLTWNDMVVYQNITLIVCADVLTNVQITMLGVALSLALGLGLVCVGYIWDIPFLIAFSGFIWLFASVTVYKEISVGWTVIALGLGVILLGAGGFQLVEESEY